MFLYLEPYQPGLLSGPMRREMEKGLSLPGWLPGSLPGSPDLFALLDWTAPSGLKRWSTGGVPTTLGQYEPRIRAWNAPLGLGIDVRSGNLASPGVTLQILDGNDRLFSTELERNRKQLANTTALLRIGSKNVSPGDWYTAMNGVLVSYAQTEPMVWTLALGPNDVKIRNGVLPDLAITKGVFPNADGDALSKYVPLIGGVHNSQGLSGQGFIPTFYIDTAAFLYLVAIGKVSVPAVYKDGALLATSAYAITYPVYAGRVLTVIDFPSTQGTSTITCDARGFEDRGDGTGSTILNPALLLRHILVNFVFGAWVQGGWLAPGSAPLDLASFTAAADWFDGHRGYRASCYIGGGSQQKVLDVVQQWAESFDARLYWTNEGKLAIGLIDYAPQLDLYGADLPWIKLDTDSGDLLTPFDAGSLVNRLSIGYVRGVVGGQTYNELPVSEYVTADKRVAESREAIWSAASSSDV